MGIETAAVIGGAALIGGIAGGKKDKSTATSTSSNVSEVITAPESDEEKRARALQLESMNSLDARLKSIEASPVLNNLDRLLAELGSAPSQERMAQAQRFTQDVFAPQKEALSQAFDEQNVNFARRAAQQGRSSADPILAAKLAQEQIRQQNMMAAEQRAFAAQEAINAPARQFQNQLGALGGLSQQAIQNRQAVFSLGSDFANSLQNYRVATATRTGTSSGTQTQESGGGFKGVLTGALGGAAAGVGMANAGGLFGNFNSASTSLPSSGSMPSVGSSFGMRGPQRFNFGAPY